MFCYGVLDCCRQEKIISELVRVAKVGGYVYMTGKNFHYFSDDALAIEAEIKARNNKFPNHFTKLSDLQKQLKEQGVEIVKTLYYPRRGDASRFYYSTLEQDVFYEWAMLVKKKSKKDIVLYNIASECSQVYKDINSED